MTGRIGLHAAAATLVAAAALSAFMYGTQTTGYTFAMGNSYNLTIDDKGTYNGVLVGSATWALKDLVPTSDKFWNFGDIKPGDRGENTISLHVNKDSWICLDFSNLTQKENGVNEPESHVDNSGGATQGELAAGTEFFAWYDDGDNIFQVGEKPIFGTSTQSAVQVLNNKTYVLADSIAGNAFPANQTKYIGIQWCAGNLTVNLATAVITCDGATLGNAAQTDSFAVDVSFRAVPKLDQPTFRCEKTGQTCDRSGCNANKCNNSVNIIINNNGTINSTTTANSNTGGNIGGNIITGNASSSSSSTNILNQIFLNLGF